MIEFNILELNSLDFLEPKPKEEDKDKHYSDRGDHGARHDYQQEVVRKEQKSCDRDCANCPIAKSCTK